MTGSQLPSSVISPQVLSTVKNRTGKVEAWVLWAIWLSTWFSPLKLSIGLNLASEFMLAYLLVLYYLIAGRFSMTQVVGIFGLGVIAVFDFMRNQDPKVFMFLGFAFVNFSMVEFVRRPVASAQRLSYLFFLVPMLAVLMRFLFPGWGAIDGYDTSVVDGEVVQRFNLLGYESNSLATMMTMLMGAILAGVGRLKLIWRLVYCIFCIAVVGATLSRTGIFAVTTVLVYFTLAERSGSRSIVLLLLCCMLGIALSLPDLGPMLEAISGRASEVNYLENERGAILIERLGELQQSPSLFFFGRGFMVNGASDSSFMALLHGYGYLGALVTLIFLLFSLGIAHRKISWHPQLGGIFIAIFFFLLTGDIYGQAKIIGCFYCLVAARTSLQPKRITAGSSRGTR